MPSLETYVRLYSKERLESVRHKWRTKAYKVLLQMCSEVTSRRTINPLTFILGRWPLEHCRTGQLRTISEDIHWHPAITGYARLLFRIFESSTDIWENFFLYRLICMNNWKNPCGGRRNVSKDSWKQVPIEAFKGPRTLKYRVPDDYDNSFEDEYACRTPHQNDNREITTILCQMSSKLVYIKQY